MNRILTEVFRKLRASQRGRAKQLRERTDAIRKKTTSDRRPWDSVTIIRTIRNGG